MIDIIALNELEITADDQEKYNIHLERLREIIDSKKYRGEEGGPELDECLHYLYANKLLELDILKMTKIAVNQRFGDIQIRNGHSAIVLVLCIYDAVISFKSLIIKEYLKDPDTEKDKFKN